jgi:hypothetical protein
MATTAMGRTADTPGDGARRLGRVVEAAVSPIGGAAAVGLVVVGLIVIGLGWNGAAGSGSEVNGVPDIRAQLPWLISGGALGLALVVIGAAQMITQSHRADRVSLEAKLDELTRALGAGATGPGAVVRSGPADLADLVVAGSTSYHRPDCRLAQGRAGSRYLTTAEANEAGLKACRICQPD